MKLKLYPLGLALLVFITLTASITVSKAISSAEPDAQLPSALTLKPDAAVITWRGSHDNRWGDPRNWDSGRVPGPSDVARFTQGPTAEVEIDSKAIGIVGAMVVDADFHGTIVLGRDFTIASSLLLQSGNFRQGDHDLTVNSYRQDGGSFEGGKSNLIIQQRAVVNGGTLLTSKHMVASSLTIGSSAVVTTGANSKLNLTGDGTPLNGDGLLDVTTNGPTSVEYTGKANTDITTAIPLRGTLSASAIKSLTMAELQAAKSRPALLPMANALSRSGALTLTAKEDHPFAAVIDTVNGFAYFGTLTTPGIVVKVRLSDFKRMGALVLNANEQELRSATIDETNGFAYFGGLNGAIVKIRLSDFTRVDSLNVGGPLAAAVIDSANGFAYFGAFTGPAAVVKLRLSDFTVDDILVLNDGEDGILSAVIDTANGFAYFGTGNTPGVVVKVRLSDFTRVAALTLTFSEAELTCAVIDTTNGFAYFSGFSLFFAVAKIRLSDFTRVGGIFENTGAGFFRSAVMDNSGFAYFGNDEGNIFKVRLSDLAHVSTLNIPQIRSELNCAVIDTANGFAYFGHGIRPGVVKIRLADFAEVGNVAFSRGENNLGCAVIDAAAGFAYFGTDAQPGLIIKLRLSDFTIVGVLALDDTPEASSERNFRSAVIDTTNGFAYFGSDTSPGTIVKVRLSDFTRVGALNLNPGEDSLFSAVIDTTNGFAYFAAVPFPKGKIIKIRLSDFTRVGALTLNDGERGFSAVIDPANDFAYFGAPTSPGTVVKVRLSDLSRVGAVAIMDQPLSAVIDTANGFAYFGGSGGIVDRVRLSDFSLAGQVATGTGQFHTGVIDPINGFAYFGTFGSPAKVVQIRLSTFSQGDILTLNSGEDALYSAVIDPPNSAAYFGTLTQPAKIIKVTLADAVPTPTPTPSPTPTPTPSPSPTPTPGPPVLLLEESGPVANLAAAVDSVLLLRDPFPVVNVLDLLNAGVDRNTRVIVFVSNLQLLPGETVSSVVVNLVDSNGQDFDLTAEDVRAIPNTTFTQVVFRLPNNVAIGTCTIRIKVHEQMSNPGTIRIRL